MTAELEEKQLQLSIAQNMLRALEEQAAGYTALTMPASLRGELEEQRGKIAALREKIKTLEEAAGPEPASFLPTPFQSREDEISMILSGFAPPYFLVDAPAGYGKTVLVERLAERFTEDHWLVAYVRLGSGATLRQLVATLARELGLEYSPPGQDAYRWGAEVANRLVEHKKEALTRNGLVFLVDLGKGPALNLLRDFVDLFIPAVQERLRMLEFFSSRHNRFRAVIAGRHLAGRSELSSPAIPLSILQLAPFDYTVIWSTVRALFTEHNDAAVSQVAAHLMYLTGGHPGCVAHSMREYEETGYAPDDFLAFCSEKIWEDIVKPTARTMRNDIPQDLRHTLDRLSVFRYLNYPLLDRLTSGKPPIITGYESGYDLADRLTGAYLMSWQRRLLQSDIMRQLLVVRQWHEEEDFPAWCRQAQEMLADHLQRPDTQSPEIWAIEYLYQILQEHAEAIPSPEQRTALRDRFFTNEVSKALRSLTGDREKRMEEQALEEALESDWEFRFTVNYFLREEAYTDLPYRRLLEEVNAFFRG